MTQQVGREHATQYIRLVHADALHIAPLRQTIFGGHLEKWSHWEINKSPQIAYLPQVSILYFIYTLFYMYIIMPSNPWPLDYNYSTFGQVELVLGYTVLPSQMWTKNIICMTKLDQGASQYFLFSLQALITWQKNLAVISPCGFSIWFPRSIHTAFSSLSSACLVAIFKNGSHLGKNMKGMT